MYLVALTRWGSSPAEEAVHLAAGLRMTAYDLRLKLAGPLPVVIRSRLTRDVAEKLRDELRGRGHGAVSCNLAALPSSESLLCPRGFAFRPDAFVAIAFNGDPTPIAWSKMIGFIHAATVGGLSTTTTTTEKKFSVGRAVLSGGLVRSRTVDTTITESDSEWEPVLYVFHSAGSGPILLRQHGLRYDGLEAARQPTALANFGALVSTLRQRAPGVFYDDRLFRQKKRVEVSGVDGPTSALSVSTSNASANDVAAMTLMCGHLQGQL